MCKSITEAQKSIKNALHYIKYTHQLLTGSDNVLLPVLRHDFIWTNAMANISVKLIHDTSVFIQENGFQNVW